MSRFALFGAVAAISSGVCGATAFADSAVLIQTHAASMPQEDSPAAPANATKDHRFQLTPEQKKMLTEAGKSALKNAVREKVPYGVGYLLVNDKDPGLVKKCSDISSSLYCSTSQKVFGIKCAGWGGSSCLEVNAPCTSITVQGACTNSINRLNISCLGWGGSHCLPMGAKAKLISSEALCLKSEIMLGIRSVGWSGRECLDKLTAACDKISKPGICNDAQQRLGISCGGWGGSSCLSKRAQCSQISTRHICQTAQKRFNISCGWGMGGQCKDGISN